MILADKNNPFSSISVFDFNKEKTIRSVRYCFNVPAFAHLGLSRDFAVSSSIIAAVQPSKYDIMLLDFNLDTIGEISKNDSAWVNISKKDSAELAVMEPGSPATELLMDKMDHCSYLKGTAFINDSTLMVWYYYPMVGKKYFFEAGLNVDIWHIDLKTFKASMLYSGLQDTWNFTETMSYRNIPVLIDFNRSGQLVSGNNYVVIPRISPKEEPIGHSFDEFNKLEDEYYMSNNPQLKLYFYKYGK
jgi:hypothetical protein